MLAAFSYARLRRPNRAMGEDVEKLKQRLPLLDYLRQQNWTARPAGHGPEFVGLCPLHPESRPSFYVNARKNLFYCHGCGQGGDLIRFVELSRHLSFRQSLAYLGQQSTPPADPATVLKQAATFYQQQLDRYPGARWYLEQRGLRDPALVEDLQIGYALGGSLRGHLSTQGYSFDLLRRLGLVNRQCGLFEGSPATRHFALVSNIWDWKARRLIERHREKAGTIEAVHDVVKNELAGGVLPSKYFGANAAWLRLAAIAHNVLTALKRLALLAELLRARPKRLRFLIFNMPGRVAYHARRMVLRLVTRLERLGEWMEAWRLLPLRT